MESDFLLYGPVAADLLQAAGFASRRMDLVAGECTAPAVKTRLKQLTAKDIFPDSVAPEAALSGLYLYISCFEEAHNIAQDIHSAEGSYWHAIMHRQEPDAGNASYWFHRVGEHSIFPALALEAEKLGYQTGPDWDPLQFIAYCEKARHGGLKDEQALAIAVQHAEWQLLFDHCARPKE